MNTLRAALLNPLAPRRFGVAAVVLLLVTVLFLIVPSDGLMHFILLPFALFVTTPASVIAAIGVIPAVRRRFWLFLLLTPVAYFIGLWLFLVVAVNTGRFKI